jgi:8-oxo-dGTP pyrophosphatase MutT (NUDIX family)
MSRFAPLRIGGKRYGFVLKDVAAGLPEATGLFVREGDGIALKPDFADFSARSEALLRAAKVLAARREKPLHGEKYAVVENWGDAPVAEADRAAVPWFGMRAWGIHVNGFVRRKDGIYLWIGERAADRPSYPGKLDNMIGGGQPIGLTVEENLCKEAQEEAGIEAALALTAKPVRTIDYRVERHDGLRSDTLFVYDLELPEGYAPRNTDGEVARFHLMPLPQVAALVRETDRFKFNCNLVVADFLLRHGFIPAEDKEYGELRGWLEPPKQI